MPCISTVHFFLFSDWERVGSWKESTNLIPVWCNLYTTDHAESPPASKCYQQRRRAAREGIVFTFVCPCLHYATVFCGRFVDFYRPRHKSYLKRYSHYIYIYQFIYSFFKWYIADRVFCFLILIHSRPLNLSFILTFHSVLIIQTKQNSVPSQWLEVYIFYSDGVLCASVSSSILSESHALRSLHSEAVR